MKCIGIILCISLSIVLLAGMTQALDIAPAGTFDSTTPGQTALTVVFAGQETLFAQQNPPSISQFLMTDESDRSTPDTPLTSQLVSNQVQDAQVVPEPSTLLLVGLGMLSLFGCARWKHNNGFQEKTD